MAWTGPVESKPQGDPTGLLNWPITSFGATIPVGTLIVISMCGAAASSSTTCADNSSQTGAANVYTVRTAVNGTAHHGRHITCVTSRAILTTDTITISQGAPATRQSLCLTTWTPPLSTTPIDASVTMAALTASPCAMGPTGVLLDSNELAIASHWWKGGAVASGVADATTGYTLVAPANSGGITTSTEACVSWKNPAGTAAESNTKSFTSITNCVGELLTFRTTATVVSAAPRDVLGWSTRSGGW